MMAFGFANAQDKPGRDVDWQGHRGARGAYPENTISGFLYALDEGMNTLEMDVVITADSQVVVSHEPFMSSQICLDPDGEPISKRGESRFNIYEMTYDEVKKFDCGSKKHPEFDEQTNTEAAKPLLQEVIELSLKHARDNDLEKPHYNIEIKSRPGWEGKYHPSVQAYTQLVLQVLDEAKVTRRTTIQSFDPRVLQYLDTIKTKVQLSLLVDAKENAAKKLSMLGFYPDVLSPHYKLVDEKLMKLADKEGMKVIVWTVNDKETAQRLIADYKVHGIITDYPLLREEIEGPDKTIGPD